jgi:SAM-dependent methyltransferase
MRSEVADPLAQDLAVEEAEIQSHLESVDVCPICGDADFNVQGIARTIHPESEISAQLMECRACSHWFITPTPTQEALVSLYSRGSPYVVGREWKGIKKGLSIPERYIVGQESRTSRQHCKYLEIGIGAGLLFDYFKDRGYECVGVEPGAWARNGPGLVNDIEDLEDSYYDLVVMADVLEHVRDPLGMVRFVSQRMKSGTLYACFPNNQSLRAKWAKSNWRMVRPFGHLHFFSKQSLTIMFESNGFRLADLRKTDRVDFCLRSLLWPPHQSVVRMFMLPTQRLWGDQWIVQAEKTL